MQPVKKEYQDKSGLDLAKICARVAIGAKAEDLVILDVKGVSSFTDYFVIMSGRSTRHVQGLAEIIEGEMRSKRINTSHAEGLEEGLWVLLDFNDVVVHIFYHEQRKFYDLESLWHDARPVKIADL
jgi:ribosome-associated protein